MVPTIVIPSIVHPTIRVLLAFCGELLCIARTERETDREHSDAEHDEERGTDRERKT